MWIRDYVPMDKNIQKYYKQGVYFFSGLESKKLEFNKTMKKELNKTRINWFRRYYYFFAKDSADFVESVELVCYKRQKTNFI